MELNNLTLEETKSEYNKIRTIYKEKRSQMFDLQHEVEALGKQMDALEKIADKNDWELIDDPIFSKDKIRDVLKECGIMNIETDIIKMLEDHSANRTYASDIETAMQYNGYSEREAVNGIKKLISDGKVTSDGVKIKLVK